MSAVSEATPVRGRGAISFAADVHDSSVTPPPEGAGAVKISWGGDDSASSINLNMSRSATGVKVHGANRNTQFGKTGVYMETLKATEDDVEVLTHSQRVTKLRETSVTQRFNIFQERRRGTIDKKHLEEQQEKLQESILASRKAVKKVARVFTRAEQLCNELFVRAMQRRQDVDEHIRVHVDEYIKICTSLSKDMDSHTLHYRFCTVVDEMRTLRFDLHGVIEHSREITDRCGSILGEIYARLCHVSGAILRDACPDDVVRASSRSFVDNKFGLVIQQWENPEAVKQWGKAIERFMNYAQSIFHSPCFVVVECCGRTFSAMTMVPIQRLIVDPLAEPWMQFYIDKALCETHLKPDRVRVMAECRFAYGYDGRLYCIRANGLVPGEFNDAFLEDYEGDPATETMSTALLRNVEHVCTELTAVSRANACEVSKVMHKHGLSMQYIHHVHAYLSRTEQTREQAANAVEDHNLVDALRAVISEILSRVLKVIIREQALTIAPAEDHVMAREMAAMASQLVYSQVIEGLTEGDQLYSGVAKIAQRLFPPNKKAKIYIWEEYFVSEEQIAARVARFLGMQVAMGVIAMTSPYRFVRGSNLRLPQRRLAVVRGKHREVLQKLVSRIKSSRAFSAHFTASLTYALADVFHQANTRSGVTNSPEQVYAQLLAAKTSDDDTELSMDEYETKMLQAQQATYLFACKRISSREAIASLNAYLEISIRLTKTAPPHLLPFFMATRVRILYQLSKFVSETAVLTQLESCLQNLDNLIRKANKDVPNTLDPRHANWMWRLLYNGLAAGKGASDPEQSIAIVRRKLEQARETFGDGTLPVIGCVTDVATQLADLGRHDEAVTEFKHAADLLSSVDPYNRMAFTTANNLGVTYFMMASKQCPETLKRRRATFLRLELPADVVDLLLRATEQFQFVLLHRQHAELKQIADALNNLGSVNLFRMRYGEAMTCFEDSLALTREHYSDDHPDRINAHKNLKLCEKMMRQKAAILIGCWVKRVRAQAQLGLLKKGNQHVKLFQRVGRGMFVRLQLHRHAEKKRIKMMQQQRIAAATAAAAATRQPAAIAAPLGSALAAKSSSWGTGSGSPVIPQQAAANAFDDINEDSSRSAGSPVWDAGAPITASKRAQPNREEAAVVLQAVGRGHLSRCMLAEMMKVMRLRRKKK